MPAFQSRTGEPNSVLTLYYIVFAVFYSSGPRTRRDGNTMLPSTSDDSGYGQRWGLRETYTDIPDKSFLAWLSADVQKVLYLCKDHSPCILFVTFLRKIS